MCAKECRKGSNKQLSRCDGDVEGRGAMIGHLITEKQRHQHEIRGKRSWIQERGAYYSCAGLQKAVEGRGGGEG